jgi:hypothetical protein
VYSSDKTKFTLLSVGWNNLADTCRRLDGTRRQHSTVQHCTVQHSTALHSTAQHCTAQHSTALHCTAQHSTVQYCTVQHSTAQYSTALHSKAQHTLTTFSTLCLANFRRRLAFCVQSDNSKNSGEAGRGKGCGHPGQHRQNGHFP